MLHCKFPPNNYLTPPKILFDRKLGKKSENTQVSQYISQTPT